MNNPRLGQHEALPFGSEWDPQFACCVNPQLNSLRCACAAWARFLRVAAGHTTRQFLIIFALRAIGLGAARRCVLD